MYLARDLASRTQRENDVYVYLRRINLAYLPCAPTLHLYGLQCAWCAVAEFQSSEWIFGSSTRGRHCFWNWSSSHTNEEFSRAHARCAWMKPFQRITSLTSNSCIHKNEYRCPEKRVAHIFDDSQNLVSHTNRSVSHSDASLFTRVSFCHTEQVCFTNTLKPTHTHPKVRNTYQTPFLVQFFYNPFLLSTPPELSSVQAARPSAAEIFRCTTSSPRREAFLPNSK